MKKRIILAILFFVTALIPVFNGAEAADSDKYPSRNIEFVVNWGAGGGSDTFARILSIPLRKILNTTISVVNMPGGGGAIGMEYVQSQPADGYTLLSLTPELLILDIQKRVNHSYKDYTPIMRGHVDIGMIQVSEKTPFQTWEKLLAFAKSGDRKIRVGGTGSGTADHIYCNVVFKSAGILDRITYVPYGGAGEMHAALLGGHIDAMYEEAGNDLSLIEAKKLSPVIVFADKRLDRFPGVPCLKEFGYEQPPMMWRGIVMKKGAPQNVVDILDAAFKKARETDLYQAFEEKRLLNLYPGYMDSKTWAKDLDREYNIYKQVLTDLGQVK